MWFGKILESTSYAKMQFEAGWDLLQNEIEKDSPSPMGGGFFCGNELFVFRVGDGYNVMPSKKAPIST